MEIATDVRATAQRLSSRPGLSPFWELESVPGLTPQTVSII